MDGVERAWTYLGEGGGKAVTVEPLDGVLGHIASGVHEEAKAFAKAGLAVQHGFVADDYSTG